MNRKTLILFLTRLKIIWATNANISIYFVSSNEDTLSRKCVLVRYIKSVHFICFTRTMFMPHNMFIRNTCTCDTLNSRVNEYIIHKYMNTHNGSQRITFKCADGAARIMAKDAFVERLAL